MISETTYDQHPPDREFGPTVLIVDDEEHARNRLKLALESVDGANSLHIIHCKNLPDALNTIAGTTVHVVLLDKDLKKGDPTQNGINAIPLMLDFQPHLQILMVTGSNDIQDVVRAMKNGACGYITKETHDDLLITYINRAINVALLSLDKIRRDRHAMMEDCELGGKSRVFQEIMKQARLLAESNRPVLLLGETGTGKTEIAKWINKCRQKFLKQQDRPFFAVNAATLTKELMESELFGHEKGAFTGAVNAKQGLFELAGNGTLFLDEIGELHLDLQAKLLTVIEEGTFKRVGGEQERRSSPKLIFATNRDLEKMVAEGTFRKDLWMRINMFPLYMPSLSERREDIPDVIRALLPKVCEENHVFVNYEQLPLDFIEHVTHAPLEGNIRGIRNQLDRLLVLSPRDDSGRPILKKWKTVRGLYVKRTDLNAVGLEANEKLTLAEVSTRPTNLINADFPGLNAALEIFSRRILSEAASKFKKNKDIAKALKIPESSASVFIKRLNVAKPERHSGSQMRREEEVLQ